MSFALDFLAQARDLRRVPDREDLVYEHVARGCYVPWGRHRVVVRERQYDVWDDYLALGTADDFLRVPVSLPLAVRVLDLLGARDEAGEWQRAVLPTCAVVDEVYRRADVRLDPVTWNAEASMLARREQVRKLGSPFGDDSVWVQQHARSEAVQCGVELLVEEDLLTEAERAGRTGLVAGHRKDLVSDSLASHPGRVAIYGWHTRGGKTIQPLYPSLGSPPRTGHEDTYADYSHGLRPCWVVQ